MSLGTHKFKFNKKRILSMKTFLTKILVGTSLCLFLISCGGGGGSSDAKPTPTQAITKANTATSGSWTVFVYISGNDLESMYGAASTNIEEMLKAQKAENVNVILATGGASSWKNKNISAFALDYHEIKNHELVQVKRSSLSNMGESKTLSDFIAFGKDNYKADHYALIFWDHGGGGYTGVCFDENFNNDSLNLNEIDEALTQNAINFEFIGFDACLMSGIETIQVMKKHAKTMIASESTSPLEGWEYASVLENLNKTSLYEKILNEYKNKSIANESSIYSLSVIDLENADDILSAFDSLSNTLSQSESLQPIVLSALDAHSFGRASVNIGYTNLVDLKDFSKKLENTQLVNAINKNISSIKSPEQGDSGGINFYYPLRDLFTLTLYYKNTNLTTYKSFLQEYYSPNKVGRMIQMENMGENNGNELEFIVKSDKMKYIQDVSYKLYQGYTKDGKGYITMYGEDSTVIQTDNKYKTRFSGKWYSLNGRLLRVNITNQDKDITLYESPIKLNGIPGTLRFAYTYKDKKAKILGFMSYKDNIAGRVVNIKPDDNITIVYVIGEGNNVNYSFKEIESFKAKDLKLDINNVPDGNYLIVGSIIDVYGYHFTTNGIEVNVKDGNVSFEELVPAKSDGTDNVIYYTP